jgi:membrane protease subunit HflK
MAWNDSGDGKDPWKKEGREPHDLDRIVQNWQRRIAAIFGGSGGGGARTPGGSAGAWVLIVLLVIAWGLTGLYRVDEAERGIVQRFGAYTVTAMPGLHWHLPYPIETVDIVNTDAVNNYSFRTEILTADESYVFIQMVVQYRRSDPVKYSFEVVDPEMTVQDVTESALREVVGTSTLEVLVTERRDEIAPRTQEILQNTLDTYGSGINDQPREPRLSASCAGGGRRHAESAERQGSLHTRGGYLRAGPGPARPRPGGQNSAGGRSLSRAGNRRRRR